MTRLAWDALGEHRYETGVDCGVLYLQTAGVYDTGFAWNGLTTVTESPKGGEATALYADNIKYLNLISLEEFEATLEAFTYPDEFCECDGSYTPFPGVAVGQQPRRSFGLSYRTRVGTDTNSELGYKLHLVYGATAAPSEKAFATINDSPSAITFSWSIWTTPVQVAGHKPTSIITIDSSKVDSAALAALEDLLYGTVGTDPSLPLPSMVLALFDGTVTEVTPTQPTFVSSTGVITIPAITGVIYKRGDTDAVVAAGTVTIAGTTGASLLIYAVPDDGYSFTTGVDDDWLFTRTA